MSKKTSFHREFLLWLKKTLILTVVNFKESFDSKKANDKLAQGRVEWKEWVFNIHITQSLASSHQMAQGISNAM